MSNLHTPLITIDDFKSYREITQNVNELTRLQPYIIEAQKFDFKPVIGDEMYFDFIINISQQKYQDLLNGKQYTDLAGNQILYDGLKPALAYYAYARFIQNNAVATSYGLVRKKNEDSVPVAGKDLQILVQNAQACAFAEIRMMERFLRDNQQTYPLWIYWHRPKANKGINIRGVGGFDDPNSIRNLNYPYRNHEDRYLP